MTDNKLVSITVYIDKGRKEALKYWANRYSFSLSEYIRLILLNIPLPGVHNEDEDLPTF